MARVTFANGKSVNFEGNPTPSDIDHVAQQMGIQSDSGGQGAGQMGNVASAQKSGYSGYTPPPLTSSTTGKQQAPDQFGAPFPVTPGENPLQAGAKFVGNLPSSTAKLGGGLLTAATHPLQAAGAIGGTIVGGASELGRALGTGANVGQPATPEEHMFDSLVGQYKQNYFTSPEDAEKKIVEDPAGFITDAATLFMAGGGAVKGADIAAGTSKADLLAQGGAKSLKAIENSIPFPIQETIDSGAVPREAIYKNGDTLTPEFAKGRIDDIAQKLDNFQSGLGPIFRDKVDVNNATMADLIQNGKDTLLNESTGKFQNLVNNAVSKSAGLVTKPVGVLAPYIKNAAASAISQVTGLEPESIKDILSNPQLFSKPNMDATTRGALTNELSDAIDQKASDLGEAGQQYSAFRQSTDPVNVSQQGYIDLLKKKGIDATFDPKDGWSLETSKESIPISSADQSNITNYLNQYASEDTHTGNSFLNARQKLAQLAKYETASGKTSAGMSLARDFRNYLNTTGRQQIPGLEAADAQYEPLITDLNQIKSDFVNARTGELKDTAASKLANAGNKEALLSRVEKLMPGITEKLQHLKTMEDISAATGNKVGAYGRAIAGGLGLSAFGGGPAVGGPAGLALWIISNPGASVPILRWLGYSENILQAVNDSAKAAVPAMQGANLLSQMGNGNPGLIDPKALGGGPNNAMNQQQSVSFGGISPLSQLAGAAAAFPPPAPTKMNYHMQQKNDVAFFGDSGFTNKGLATSSDALPQQIEKLLDGKKVGAFAESGDTTKEALSKVDSVIASHPKSVVLKFGQNDLGKVSPAQTQRNLETIIRKLKRAGINVLLVNAPPASYQKATKQQSKIYSDIYKKVAMDTGISLSNIPKIDPANHQPDGHLTAKGYSQWAASMILDIKKFLQQ